MNIIDTHLHLFALAQGRYHWLKAENPPFWPDKSIINREFSEQDLQLATPLKLAGFVHIEAGFDNQQPAREIAWLEQHCQLPFRSIAFIDLQLSEPEFLAQLTQLTHYRSVVGCRYILDDDTASNQAQQLLKNARVLANLTYLANAKLVFECQISLRNHQTVNALVALLTQLPKLKVIINHAGFPPSSTNGPAYQQWLNSLDKLSQFKQCAIKCSGLEMLDRQYSQTRLYETLQALVYFFGVQRIMCASNFPLCLFSHSYQQVWQHYQQLPFDNAVIEKLCHHNAAVWYLFPPQIQLNEA